MASTDQGFVNGRVPCSGFGSYAMVRAMLTESGVDELQLGRERLERARRALRRKQQFRKGRSDRVPIACLIVFSLVWLAVAISPRYRDAWLLEHSLTMIAVPLAVATYRRFPLSDRSYVMLTTFMLLHTIGSYYTYSEVPIGFWVRDALGLARNHYDRFVHFAFGLLVCRPMRELTIPRPAAVGPFPTALLSVALVALASVTYEVLEWWAAVLSDPNAGTAFLGTQGDEWDAQWDMALACGGGMIAAFVHWTESRRTRPSRPLEVRRRADRIRSVATRQA